VCVCMHVCVCAGCSLRARGFKAMATTWVAQSLTPVYQSTFNIYFYKTIGKTIKQQIV
jgi:hypothetical protein